MKFNETACRATGIPVEHAEVFQKVANDWQSVIVSRAVGPACTELIKSGYASKAFHVKAKSCNWGPMAGFLLADPRLTKRKKADWEKQNKDIRGPMEEGYCTTTPLLITENRVKHILFSKDGKYARTRLTDQNISANDLPDELHVKATSPDNETFKFTLMKSKVEKQEKANNKLLWAVYFTKGTEASVKQKNKDSDNTTALIPVRAIVNAEGDVPNDVINNPKLAKRYKADSGWVEGYRGACTGDYDLFAVLPLNPDKKKQGKRKGNIPFEKKGIDIRPVKLGIKKPEAKLLKAEHPDYGNMTARIFMIRDNLNEGFQKADGWTDRVMVHHSDEGGRPFWPEIDYPLHAFIPLSDDKRHYAIEYQGDLVDFFKGIYKLGYQIVIPPNWKGELGEDLKAAHVPYTVPTWTKGVRKRADLVRKEAMAQSISDAFAEPKPLAMLNGMKVLFDESVPVQPVNLVAKDKPSLKVRH